MATGNTADDVGVGPLATEIQADCLGVGNLACQRRLLEIEKFDGVTINVPARSVSKGSNSIALTPKEFDLLLALIRRKGAVASRMELLKEVWGPLYVEHTQYLRVFMAQLRQKLEPDPAKPRYLLNEPGVGYRLRVD